jgi:PAS domain S-box-containing protein
MSLSLLNPTQDSYNFDILFYKSPQPMWIFDSNTLFFLEVNDAAISTYGYSKDEFLNMTIKDIRPVENYGDISKVQWLGENTHTLESRHNYKSGEIINVEVTTFPFSFQQKAGRLAYVRNITTKKKRESLLEYLNMAGEELGLTKYQR